MWSQRALLLCAVCAEDSGIASIPLVTLNAMWEKAAELLKMG